jgi:GNAT superfamily N-acetyltransferase
MKFRKILNGEDIQDIREILESSGYFYDFEVDVALELAELNFSKGEEASGYIFLLVEENGKLIAFASYGKTPCTVGSYDLYWIAVHKDYMNKGLGKLMINMIEEDVAGRGGKNLWIETSSRPLYEPTRQFYLKTSYKKVAELPHFYALNDNKIIFVKYIKARN